MKALTYGQLGKALIRLLLRPRRRYQLDMFKDIRPEMFLDAHGETYVGYARAAIREYVLAHFPQNTDRVQTPHQSEPTHCQFDRDSSCHHRDQMECIVPAVKGR